MFDQNYDDGIVSQQFFLPQIDVVTSSPEPSSGVVIGGMLIGLMTITARYKHKNYKEYSHTTLGLSGD
jgi:hypothetical protein